MLPTCVFLETRGPPSLYHTTLPDGCPHVSLSVWPSPEVSAALDWGSQPAQEAMEVEMGAGSSFALTSPGGQKPWQSFPRAGKQLSALRNPLWKGDVEEEGLGKKII